MVTILIDQFLSNSDLYENECLENIEKLFKSSGKCNYQQQYKTIIELAIVSTTEIFTETVQCQLVIL